MKEEVTRNLVQKSTVKTSGDFTDNLLLKLEAEKAPKEFINLPLAENFYYSLLGIIGVGIVIFGVIQLGFIPKFSLLNFQLKISITPFLIITALLVLIGLNHILKLHQLASSLNKS